MKTKIKALFFTATLIAGLCQIHTAYAMDRDEESVATSRPLSAKFTSTGTWAPQTNTEWEPVTFNVFQGDEVLRGNLSLIEIPRDGMYLLSAQYYWGARNGPAQTRTAIATQTAGNIYNDWHHHNLPVDTDIKNGITRLTPLKKGEIVMLSTQGSPNANIFLGHFEFKIQEFPSWYVPNQIQGANPIEQDEKPVSTSRSLSAILSYKNHTTWASFSSMQRHPLTFEVFNGDESLKGETLSGVTIPTDGLYKVIAHYHWHSTNAWTAPETSITINVPTNEDIYEVHHLLPSGHVAKGTKDSTYSLKKGDKVMLSLKGYENSECYLNDFWLKVESLLLKD